MYFKEYHTMIIFSILGYLLWRKLGKMFCFGQCVWNVNTEIQRMLNNVKWILFVNYTIYIITKSALFPFAYISKTGRNLEREKHQSAKYIILTFLNAHWSPLSLNSSPWKSLPRTITRVLWPRKSNPNWTSSLSGHLTGYLWKASLISSASAAWGQTRGTIVPAHMRGERERFPCSLPYVQTAQNPANRSNAKITTRA